jgi:hypothetical protein
MCYPWCEDFSCGFTIQYVFYKPYDTIDQKKSVPNSTPLELDPNTKKIKNFGSSLWKLVESTGNTLSEHVKPLSKVGSKVPY